MRTFLTRSTLAVLLALFMGTAMFRSTTPAFAATPCFAASCDGMDPLKATACGFTQYGGAEKNTQQLTILYSRTCHAAYVELDWTTDPGSNVKQTGVYFYIPPYGGPEQPIASEMVSRTVQYSMLINWDYSIKGCFIWDYDQPFDPGPSSTDPDFCTPWS